MKWDGLKYQVDTWALIPYFFLDIPKFPANLCSIDYFKY